MNPLPPNVRRGSLPPEEARTTIERALATTLLLAHGMRIHPHTTTVASLRAVPRAPLYDFQLRYVEEQGKTYVWDSYSREADDGAAVIKPADAGETGRWVRGGGNLYLDRFSSGRTGWARTVRLYSGEWAEEALAEIFGQKPSFVLVPGRAVPRARSTRANTFYEYAYEYRLWCISQSLRKGPAARHGSRIASEAEEDPGLNHMVGAAKRALAHHGLGIPAVARVEFGAEEPIVRDLTDRVMVESLALTVWATQHFPDADIHQVEGFHGELALRQGEYDPRNYVAHGGRIAVDSGLTATITACTATVSGVLTMLPDSRVKLQLNREHYRDLRPGAAGWTIQAVQVGAAPPPLETGALRVAVTRTSSTSVVSDQYLCALSLALTKADIPKG